MSDAISFPAATGFSEVHDRNGWQVALNWVSAILIAIIFLAAGVWKITEPVEAAQKLAQLRVPESLSIPATVALGTIETFTGLMLLIPRFRRWGSVLASLLLVVFMGFIGWHYAELRGADCSCFPWLKRAVGPGFFVGDGLMLLAAIGAGLWSQRVTQFKQAALLLAGVAVLAGASFGYASTRHTGTKAPETIMAEDGTPISLTQGKVFVYFFNPQCLHCLAAGRRLAALNWGTTRFVGVPTENPQFGDWFMGKAGLTGKGPVSKDLALLQKTFPFDTPPAGVALENGYEKTLMLQFEDKEPLETLKRLGFVN